MKIEGVVEWLYDRLQICLPQFDSGRLLQFSGCGLGGKAPALGAGDRRFESCHPDQVC